MCVRCRRVSARVARVGACGEAGTTKQLHLIRHPYAWRVYLPQAAFFFAFRARLTVAACFLFWELTMALMQARNRPAESKARLLDFVLLIYTYYAWYAP